MTHLQALGRRVPQGSFAWFAHDRLQPQLSKLDLCCQQQPIASPPHRHAPCAMRPQELAERANPVPQPWMLLRYCTECSLFRYVKFKETKACTKIRGQVHKYWGFRYPKPLPCGYLDPYREMACKGHQATSSKRRTVLARPHLEAFCRAVKPYWWGFGFKVEGLTFRVEG